MDIDEFSLEQGTIKFWVKANKFEWDNDEKIELFEVTQKEGGISIVKTEENKLKATYEKGEDSSSISTDVSSLSKEERHQVAFSWSQEDNEINLYLDGEKNNQGKIN